MTTVSALRPGKCVEDALQALKLLREQHPEKSFLYTIVGDGQEEAFYKKTASEFGLNDIVSFVGRKTESEIAEILSQTDALLMASDIETFGILPWKHSRPACGDFYTVQRPGELFER